MPAEIEDYIFDSISNPMDFVAMGNVVRDKLYGLLNVHLAGQTVGLQQVDYTDVQGYRGDDLVLYITGLTAAAMEVVRFCALHGVHLTLMHFDRESGEYKPQVMW